MALPPSRAGQSEPAPADLVQLLRELVAHNTQNPGGTELELAELIRHKLELATPDELVLVEVPRATNPAPSAFVFARWGKPELVFNAHIDTVPAADGWAQNPLELTLDGDRAVALGSAGTKGAAGAMLYAALRARPHHAALLLSGDEERGNAAISAFLATRYAQGLGAAVVCEPTSCRVGVRHRGILSFRVHFKGVGGHSCNADNLPAPVADLAHVAVALDNWGKMQRSRGPAGFQGMCLNLAEVSGSKAFNIIPSHAALGFSLRPPPGANLEALQAELKALIQGVNSNARIEMLMSHVPFASSAPNWLNARLAGADFSPQDLGFWTEAALFEHAGIPAVVYGPGNIEQAHAKAEFVQLSELAEAARVFGELLSSPAARS